MTVVAAKESRARQAGMSASQLRTVGFADAKNKLSSLTLEANQTGEPFVILKNNMPWVEVRPLAVAVEYQGDEIHITPSQRNVRVANLDDLFEGYEGDFCPVEDELSAAVGAEAM